jgi:rhamnosyltransferase
MKKIAVLVRTFNNEKIIRQTLLSIMSQEGIEFSLYIVDSNSRDGTVAICKEFECSIYSLVSFKYHPGKVLNLMMDELEEEIVFFVNSDTVLLSPYVLKKMVQKMELDNVAACYGRQIARPDAWMEVKRDYLASFPKIEDHSREWISLSLPISCIKKSIWKKIRFYTDSWGSEDTEWGNRVLKNGYKIEYIASAIAMHSHNYNTKQLYNRAYVEGEADAFIYKKRLSLIEACFNLLSRTFRDILACIRGYDVLRCFVCMYRAIVYCKGYYSGHLYGQQRIENSDSTITYLDYQ